MNRKETRITLIAREAVKPDLDWNYAARTRVAFVESVAALKFALHLALDESALDIIRIVVDRAGRADDFLDLLAQLPAEFTGDVLLIRDDGTGFLSAMGRGGDRVFYALLPTDVRFYLEIHELVTGRVAEPLRMSA